MVLWSPLAGLAGAFFLALGMDGWLSSGANSVLYQTKIRIWLENEKPGHPRLPGFQSVTWMSGLTFAFQVFVWPMAGIFMWLDCVTTSTIDSTVVFTDENGCADSAIWLSGFIFYILTWGSSFWWIRVLVRPPASPILAIVILLTHFSLAGVTMGLFWAVSAWTAASLMLAYVIYAGWLLIGVILIAQGDKMDIEEEERLSS
jgi:hypothetical protein